MDNTIFLLVGHAGVGKLTTAKAISAATGARIVDNHYVNNPIFNLIELFQPTPLPQEVWARIAEVRGAVLETIATLSPPRWSFVFTFVAFDAAEDIAVYHAIRDVARRRSARFQPVRLTCEVNELTRRIASPGRREMLKDISPENARRDAVKPPLRFEETSAIELDVTHMPPPETARKIIAAASR